MVKKYIPEKGDIVWLNFNPRAGKEQSGRRPVQVLSSQKYNHFGLLIACPITSKVKGYPFEVLINKNKIKGAVLADHVKNVDWKARKIEFEDKCSQETLLNVQRLIAAILLQ